MKKRSVEMNTSLTADLPPEGSVRMATIQAIPALLTEMGVDPAPIIEETGLDPALFDDPENTVPFQDVGRLFELCVKRAVCPDLGLRLGETMTPALLGLVGTLGNSAPDVGTGLRRMAQYFHLHDRGAVPVLRIDGDQAVISYTFYEPDVPATEQIYDAAIMYGQGIIRTLAGPSWKPSEIRLSRPAPENAEPYWRRFRARVHFDADENATVFAASWLEHPVTGADALTHSALMKLVDALDGQVNSDLVTRLRRLLRVLLTEGVDEEALSLGQVSRALAIHRRTVNRRLREQGTSFKALLDEARYDISRQLLRDTRLPAVKIAELLGYADAAGFTRAFRRWSGTTPAIWRGIYKRV